MENIASAVQAFAGRDLWEREDALQRCNGLDLAAVPTIERQVAVVRVRCLIMETQRQHRIPSHRIASHRQ
jgi:hypothetical protein